MPVLQRILAGGDGDLVDEPLLHERDAVGGRRPQRTDGDAERRHVLGRDQHVLDEAARELVGGNDGVRAGDEIAIRDQLAARVQAGLEEMEAGRAVLVVRHVVFARPQQLDRHARQPRGRPLLGDDPGDPRHLDVVVAHEPPAESAAGAHEMERHVLGRNAGAERRMLLGRNLARRPDLQLPIVEVRRGVLRFERRMRQQREEVLGLDDLRRGPECRLDVADHGAGRTAGAAPAARCRCRRRRRRGCRRGRRLGRQLARLRQVPIAALRRDRTLVPGDLQRASRVVGQPPAVGHDRHARSQRVVALPGRLDDERVLDAGQPLDLVEVGADGLAAEDVALHQHRVEHVGERDVDAEDRTPVTISRLSTPRIRLPMILKSRGFLSAASMAAVSGTGRLAARDESERVGRRALGGGVRDDTARRRQLALRDVPLLRRGCQHEEPAARAHQTHVLVVGGNRAAAAFDLRRRTSGPGRPAGS